MHSQPKHYLSLFHVLLKNSSMTIKELDSGITLFFNTLDIETVQIKFVKNE